MMRFSRQFLCQKLCPDGWYASSSNFVNNIHTSKMLMVDINSIKEIKIPTSWGHIAGKWWGNPNAQPMLALHGVQDNAASFDLLAPLLDVEAILAVDIPGHGWSSHIPVGFPYDYMDGICILRYVLKHHFNWSKPLDLLGHSFGSNLCFVYSALYPNEVSRYVSLDCSRHHMSEFPTTMIASMRNTIEKMLSIEEKPKPPEYTEEELFEVFFKGRKGPEGWITKEACKVLLSRGTCTSSDGKVYLSRDPRLKLNAFGRLTSDTWLKLAPKITCSMLSIQAEHGVVRNDFKGEIYNKTLEIVLKNSPKSRHVVLPGYHHVHLDNPKLVADEINKFLSSH